MKFHIKEKSAMKHHSIANKQPSKWILNVVASSIVTKMEKILAILTELIELKLMAGTNPVIIINIKKESRDNCSNAEHYQIL